ncbi:MAG: AMP-binding protein [Oscillospiraceae bacterium]|nr:AMP-binding protein [Oscillospiraceae bacterium]
MSATYNDAMFREQFEHGYTWLNGFARNVRRYAARPAILDPLTGRSWNYRQLNAEANRLAHALRRDGVGKNDVVMAALANCPELCFAYIGPRKVGGILNLANYNLSAGELALLIDHNRPKVLLYSASVVKMVAQAVSMAKYPPAKAVMADNLKDAPLPEGHICYEDYVRDQSEEDPELDFVPPIYDEASLSTTSTRCCPPTTLLCISP